MPIGNGNYGWGAIQGGQTFDGWKQENGIKDKFNEKQAAYDQAAGAGNFAGQGEADFGQMTAETAARRRYLENVASGQHSISAEQLRQGLQQNMAQQRSMAAGASPGNAPMAARQAAMNMGRASSGMAGQAVTAGLQERRDAEAALARMLLEQRGQDANVGLGGRQTAINGYSAFSQPKGPSTFDKFLGLAAGLGGAALGR